MDFVNWNNITSQTLCQIKQHLFRLIKQRLSCRYHPYYLHLEFKPILEFWRVPQFIISATITIKQIIHFLNVVVVFPLSEDCFAPTEEMGEFNSKCCYDKRQKAQIQREAISKLRIPLQSQFSKSSYVFLFVCGFYWRVLPHQKKNLHLNPRLDWSSQLLQNVWVGRWKWKMEDGRW